MVARWKRRVGRLLREIQEIFGSLDNRTGQDLVYLEAQDQHISQLRVLYIF